MPKATDEQRAAFAQALRAAMSDTIDDPRSDEVLAERIGMSSQAIRNYLNKVREPSRETVAQIEDALGLPRHTLGQHLGIESELRQEVAALRAQVQHLESELGRVVQLLDGLARPQS